MAHSDEAEPIGEGEQAWQNATRNAEVDEARKLTTKELKKKALEMGVASVEVDEALETEKPKKALRSLILSKRAYVWTDKGGEDYMPKPLWLPGTVRPQCNVEPEQRLWLWRKGKFEDAVKTIQIAQAPKQEIDLYVCCQITMLVQRKISSLNPRSTKLALPSFNMEGLEELEDNGFVKKLENGNYKLDCRVEAKPIDINCYGPDLSELIRDLLGLDVVKKTAFELRFMLPTRLINEVVREKCVRNGRKFVDAIRKDGVTADFDEHSVKTVEKYIEKVGKLGYSDFVNKKYEPHQDTYAWVTHLLGENWRNNLEVHDFLKNFGFSERFIERRMGTNKKDEARTKEEKETEKWVKWMVKAADIFQLPGSIADVVNLIFCMLGKDPDPATEPPNIADVVETVKEFNHILEKGYWHRLVWVPNHIISDSQMDDMVAWLLLHIVCSKKNQQLVCLVQLPGEATTTLVKDAKEGDFEIFVNSLGVGWKEGTKVQIGSGEQIEDRVIARIIVGPRDSNGDDGAITYRKIHFNQPLAKAHAKGEKMRISQSTLVADKLLHAEASQKDMQELQQLLDDKHRDLLDQVQQQHESRSTRRSRVIPFRDPDSRNFDHVLSSACLIPPQTIYIVSEYEMRAFSGRYTWNGEMFESDKKRMLLHPMTGCWCFSLDVDGLNGVDKYFQIKALKSLCMPHSTLGWTFLVQAENRHSQLLARKEEDGVSRLNWGEHLTEINEINYGVLRWSRSPNRRVLIAWREDKPEWWNVEKNEWDTDEIEGGVALPKNKDDFESLWAATEEEIIKALLCPHGDSDMMSMSSSTPGGSGACSTICKLKLAGEEIKLKMLNIDGGEEIKLKIGNAVQAERDHEVATSVEDVDGYENPKQVATTFNTHPKLLAELKILTLKNLKARALATGCDAKTVDDADEHEDPKHVVIVLILEKMTATTLEAHTKLLAELKTMTLRNLKQRAVAIGCDAKAVEDADDSGSPSDVVIVLILAKMAAATLEPHPKLLAALNDMTLEELKQGAQTVGCDETTVKDADRYEYPKNAVINMILSKMNQEEATEKDFLPIWRSLNAAGDLIHGAGPKEGEVMRTLKSKPIFTVWVPPASSPDSLPPCQVLVPTKEGKKRCGLNATCDSFTRCKQHARIEENKLEKKHKCNFECPAYKNALAFLSELGVDNWIDHKWDRCYCCECYEAEQPDKIEKDDFDYKQIAPRGWVGFGVVVSRHLRSELKEDCEFWPIRFHGCNPNKLKDILINGNLARPGDRLVNNQAMKPSLRAEGMSHSMAPIFYTSPTVAYAGLQVYARPMKIHAMPGKVGQVVLQCNQKETNIPVGDIITKGAETLGFREAGFVQKLNERDDKERCFTRGVCKYTSLYDEGPDGIETMSNQPDGCVIRRVLIRTFDAHDPPTWNELGESNGRFRCFTRVLTPFETFRCPIDKPKGFPTDDGTLWL